MYDYSEYEEDEYDVGGESHVCGPTWALEQQFEWLESDENENRFDSARLILYA